MGTSCVPLQHPSPRRNGSEFCLAKRPYGLERSSADISALVAEAKDPQTLMCEHDKVIIVNLHEAHWMADKTELRPFSPLTRPLIGNLSQEFAALPPMLQAAELMGVTESDLARALSELAPKKQVCSRIRISQWRHGTRPIPLLWEARMAAYLSWLAEQLRHTYTEILGDPLYPGVEKAEHRIFNRLEEDVRLADLALDTRKILDRKMATPEMKTEMKRLEKKIIQDWKGIH